MPLFNRRNKAGSGAGKQIDLGHGKVNIDPKTGYQIRQKRPSETALRGGNYEYTYNRNTGQTTWSRPGKTPKG